MRHEFFSIQRNTRDLLRLPRTNARQIIADLSSMRAQMQAKANAIRQEAAAGFSAMICEAVLDMSVTGQMARCLAAKHA